MKTSTRFAIGKTMSLGLTAGAATMRPRPSMDHITDALAQTGAPAIFDPAVLADAPPVARRYLLHAIAPGTVLSEAVEIHMVGHMRPHDGASRIELTAHELLNPHKGFLWNARFKIGLLSMQVVDHYWDHDGGMSVRAMSVLPVVKEKGPNVTRSARHRAAAEAVWLPAALVPGPGVTWRDVGETASVVTIDVDGEHIPVRLDVDEDGRLQAVSMQRFGNVGVPEWQLLPYGMDVEEEASFGGYTIPTRIRGGWWYGTERYDPESASCFVVESARFISGTVSDPQAWP